MAQNRIVLMTDVAVHHVVSSTFAAFVDSIAMHQEADNTLELMWQWLTTACTC